MKMWKKEERRRSNKPKEELGRRSPGLNTRRGNSRKSCWKPPWSLTCSLTPRPHALQEWLDCQRELTTAIYTEIIGNTEKEWQENDLTLSVGWESMMKWKDWEMVAELWRGAWKGASPPVRSSMRLPDRLKFSQGLMFLFSGCSPGSYKRKLFLRWAHSFDEVLGSPSNTLLPLKS